MTLSSASSVDLTLDESVDEQVSGGFFSDDARSAATQHALPLLATYFAAAPTWSLDAQPNVAVGTDPDVDLAAFVRMRVTLAAGRRLEPILQRIMRRPSFFYAREADESEGGLRGQLDLPRYLRSRLRVEAPRRFPIRTIRRRHATPENIAAAYAAHWVSAELQRSPLHLLPKSSPEHREVLEQLTAFQRLLRQPVLAESSDGSLNTRRARSLPLLLDQISARMETGRIAARDAYDELLSWYEHFSPDRATATPGNVEWVFYDRRFDPKLFELWSLRLFGDALSDELGPATAPMAPLSERSRRPLMEWNFGAVKVRLHFQASMSRLAADETVRWRYTEPNPGPLRAFPDLAVTIDHVGSQRTVILVDPKLRQRSTAPTEEIYKLLGYFGNLPLRQAPLGAIIFYAPEFEQAFRLEDSSGGVLYALGVDPLDLAHSADAFRKLAELVRERSGLDPALIAKLTKASALGGDEAIELEAAVRQQAAVEAMRQLAEQLPAATLAPVRKSTAAQLSAIWDRLSDDTKTMIVTAEYFGHNAPDDADHSGPLLGLAAACERVLHEHVGSVLVAERPDLFDEGATLGAVIRWVSDGCRSKQRTLEGDYVSVVLDRSTLNKSKLCSCVGDLRRLNIDYRIPAAHRDVVTQSVWVTGRGLVLDSHDGLLARLVDALVISD